MHLILLTTILFAHSSPSQSINLDPSPPLVFSQDYGRIIENSPISILRPSTPSDISLLLKSVSSSSLQNNVTVAPRGAGHSTYGQAQAPGGIVIDMTSLPSFIEVEKTYVDAGGGALWVDVLKETLKYGLTPRSWTDYLYLTIGGTLSNAGISGQTFKHGPQISNVIELDVVTGKGEHITCSDHVNSDLFYGVLGGLGQFGIITRARIVLIPAPKMVKRIEVTYENFDQFTKSQEFLISEGTVDYLEGFIHFRANTSNASDVYYSIELAIYYDDIAIAKKTFDEILPELGSASSTVNESDMLYFDFLNRVKAGEEELRKMGQWEIRHPWLVLFVPRTHIGKFKDVLLATISDSTSNIILIYPFLRHKWNVNTSAMLPQIYPKDDIVYAVSVLRSASLACERGSQCLDTILSQNQKVIDIATAEPGRSKTSKRNTTMPVAGKTGDLSEGGGGMGAKQYLPYWKNKMKWRAHFGDKWKQFKDLKDTFDPLHILTPGQRIFKREPIEG